MNRLSTTLITYTISGLFILLAASANGQSGTNGLSGDYNGFKWSSSDGVTAGITGYDGPGGVVAIPFAVVDNSSNSYLVVAIESLAFFNTGLTSVTIPNSVTTVGDNAFAECGGLTSVTIPNSVTSIGNHAFFYSGLTSVTIPASITTIVGGTFAACGSLTSVTIPNSVTTIEPQAFAGSGLTSVTIPDSVTTIGNEAFLNCSHLICVTIPNSVTSIGESAFYSCARLTGLTIPSSVTYIDYHAFVNCPDLAPGVCFQGNAPTDGGEIFIGDGLLGICYPPGATGWGATYDGVPAFSCAQCGGATRLVGSIDSACGGSPVAGVSVQVGCFSADSSSNGSYAVAGLSLGTYSVTVTHPNFYPTNTTVTLFLYNNTTSFTLTPILAINTSSLPTYGGATFGDGIAACGSNWTVCASNNLCYAFVNWVDPGGNILSTSPCYTFGPSSATNLVANFAALTNYTVNLNSAPASGGSATGGGIVPCNSSVTVCAVPTNCFTFVNWTDQNSNAVSASACYTFTATGDVTLIAHFAPLTVATIASSSSPSGGGSTSGGGMIGCGGSATVCASPHACYQFINWTLGSSVVSTSACYTFPTSGNANLVANFMPISYTVTTTPSPVGGGSTIGDGSALCGSSPTVCAWANSCYEFENWTVNGSLVSTSACYTFVASGNVNAVANFTRVSYTVTTASSPADGGTTTGGGAVLCGSNAVVCATPGDGYAFVYWTQNNSTVSASTCYTFTVGANASLVANFAPFYITGESIQSNDVLITWLAPVALTNLLQASSDMSSNYQPVSPPIFIPPSSSNTVLSISTNYLDVGGATNGPSRFYRVAVSISLAVSTQAYDHAADPAYSGGWTNGSNGGFGFGPWTLTGSAPLGGTNDATFIGSSTSNAFGTSPGIDTAGGSWGIYANNGNYTAAYRAFGGSLPVGATLKVDMDNGFINSGNSDGFVLRNGNVNGSYANYNANARFEFLFLGGGNSYAVVDSNGYYTVGVPFTGTGLHLVFTLGTNDTYTFQIIDNATGLTDTNVTGTLAGTTGSTIDSIALYNRNSGAGPAYDAFFNSLQIISP